MKKLILFICLFIPISTFGQIWQETFDGLPNGSTSDNGATKWTTSYSGSGFVGKRQYTPYEILAIDNTGSVEGTWTSEVIDISGSSEVEIKITLGGYATRSSDYIRCYYKIDGGDEILFGEQLGAPNLTIASLASAIVSGNTLQIVFKGKENSTGAISIMAVDDITISSITYLYSRSSGNWTNGNTWSYEGYSGTACACYPNQDSHVFVGAGKIVNLNGAAITAGLTIEKTGRINHTANADLNIVRGGVLSIANGGVLDRQGHEGVLNLSTYAYNIQIDGDLSINQINIDEASVNFSGSGNINVANGILINNAGGKTITTSVAGSFTVVGDLNFRSTSSNVNFTNNGNLSLSNRIFFDNKSATFINNGTLTTGASGIVVRIYTNDGNQIINNGTMNIGAINLNSADFILNNYGTINQTGNFSNIISQSAFYNREGSTWNYNGTATNPRLFASAPDNTFNYSGIGAQTIFVPADGSYYHLEISGSGAKTMANNITVLEDLDISGTAQLDASSSGHQMNIGGDWNVTSSHTNPFIENSGIVSFNGIPNQKITTVLGQETFANLIIDKPSGNLLLAASPATALLVSNTLNLLKGGLDLNGNSLTINNPDASAIQRNQGFIKSEKDSYPYSAVKWAVGSATGAYIFPFGKHSTALNYVPFVFDITEAGTGAGIVSVATYGTQTNNFPLPEGVADISNAITPDLYDNVVNRFWQIDLTNYITNPTVSVTFTAAPDEMQGISGLIAQRWNSTADSWDEPLSQQVNPASNAVTVHGVKAFSPWGVSGNNTLLPIDLLYFKGQLKDRKVWLQWATTQEKDNDYFTVERSGDMITFSAIKEIKGQGTSVKETYYELYDENPLKGNTYYRLKQTDFDGMFTYSKIIGIYNHDENTELRLFPNPSDGKEVNIEVIDAPVGKGIKAELLDTSGQIVYSSVLQGKNQVAQLRFPKPLPPGLYILRIDDQVYKKLIVQ